MVKVRDIREMAEYISSTANTFARGANVAMMEATNDASNRAKKNAMRTFVGTRDRPKTGQLANSIFAGFEVEAGSQFASGYVGVRSKKGREGTRPYGRIHEYGGAILPVKAKNLWIPLAGPKSSGTLGQFRNMTPTEFFKAQATQRAMAGGALARGRGRQARVQRRSFAIFGVRGGPLIAWMIDQVGRGRNVKTKLTALFFLRKRVDMPARPYVTPAVEAAYARLPGLIKKRIREAFKKGV